MMMMLNNNKNDHDISSFLRAGKDKRDLDWYIEALDCFVNTCAYIPDSGQNYNAKMEVYDYSNSECTFHIGGSDYTDWCTGIDIPGQDWECTDTGCSLTCAESEVYLDFSLLPQTTQDSYCCSIYYEVRPWCLIPLPFPGCSAFMGEL